MLSLSEILTHFPPAKKIGRDYRTVCPVHGDSPSHPSLCISEGQQAILFKCETKGCAVADIIGSASPPLVWEDVLPDTTATSNLPRQVVYTATFRDEHGTALYDSLRFHPKSFAMRAASGSWSMAGVRRVLYRLNDIQGKRSLCYAEGPQKADAFWRLGLPATTHIGGAKGWAPFAASYTEQFLKAGCQSLAVFLDADPTGAGMGAEMAPTLTSAGMRVRLVDLPGLQAKQDILDFLARGGTKDQVIQAIQKTPVWTPATAVPTDTFDVISEDAYRWRLTSGITFEFDYVRRDRHELHGELTVRTTLAGAQVVERDILHSASFNASSSQARSARAELLAKRAATGHAIDWMGLLETFCARVRSAQRTGSDAILLRDIVEPETTDAFAIAGLTLFSREPVILFGDGGAAKSLVALYLAIALAERGERVLYADYEFSAEQHKQRFRRLCAPGTMPDTIWYTRCAMPLVDEVPRMARLITAHQITYLICDSIGFACRSAPEAAESATEYFRAVRRLDVGSLHTAHITKGGEENHADQRPFGSNFWHNGARSTWFIKRAEDAPEGDALEVALYQRKNNVGEKKKQPIGLRFTFQDERIRVEWFDVIDHAEFSRKLPLWQRMRRELAPGALTIQELTSRLEAKPDTVRRVVNRMHLFTRLGDDRVALRASDQEDRQIYG